MKQITIQRWKEFTKAYINYAPITDARKARLLRESEYFIGMFSDESEPDETWDEYVGDAFTAHFEDYLEHIFVNTSDWTGGYYKDNSHYFVIQLECALRAGINAASGGYGGVIGFTVGDIREMFDGEIPGWVARNYYRELVGVSDDTPIML